MSEDFKSRAKKWPKGNHYEDFELGHVYHHHWGRTLNDGDNSLFSTLTLSFNPLHGWLVASYIVVGVMAVLALGLLEPANIAVLFELKKPRPNPQVIERYSAPSADLHGVVARLD